MAAGDAGRAPATLIDFLPARLPAGVRVLLTCRPDIPLVEALRARLAGLDEAVVPPLTEEDFRRLLGRHVGDEAAARLEERGELSAVFRHLEGNPLFLAAAAELIAAEARQAAAEGRPPRVDAATLPASQEAFFRDIYYRRIGERAGTRWTSEPGRHKAELMKLLAVAREPLGFEELAGLAAAAGLPLSTEECRDRLEEMSSFLLDVGGGRFKPWHQGLTDHVRRHVLGAAGLRQTEEVFCRWLAAPGVGHYGLRHRVRHLLAAGRWDEATALLTDLAFLEAKVEAGLVFDLAGDFGAVVAALPEGHPERRHLQLLEEALRRDLHFIARHPTTLFQCLWNSCWWYDCPEAERHYAAPAGGPVPREPPWRRPGEKLSALLESWHRQKETHQPGFAWVRSLRPPPYPLGSAQQAVLSGHRGYVYSLSFSADGRRLASGGRDGTVRI